MPVMVNPSASNRAVITGQMICPYEKPGVGHLIYICPMLRQQGFSDLHRILNQSAAAASFQCKCFRYGPFLPLVIA